MPDRRFRDMRLTEEAVETEVYMHTGLVTDNGFYPGMRTSRFRSFDDGQYNSRYLRFMARAKRLLPLWREWGLRNLYRAGIAAGETMVYDLEPEELDQ